MFFEISTSFGTPLLMQVNVSISNLKETVFILLILYFKQMFFNLMGFILHCHGIKKVCVPH